MAGIGFRLQSLIKKGSYLDATTAYLSSAVISSGPWIAGVVALVFLNQSSLSYLRPADHILLTATMITVFAFSLLLASGPQLVITRYLADRLYVKERESLAPTCTGVLLLLLPFACIAAPFLFFAPFELRYRFIVFTLFLTLTMIWIIMMFLSAAREHMQILLAFLLSYALGAVATAMLGHQYGLIGCLAGFTLGQMFCLSLLIMLIYRVFPSEQQISLAYLRYFLRHWDLALISLVYTVSIWIDSAIFWFSPHGQTIQGFYHLFPPLDTAKFVMYLSTIPTSALFMIHMETNFYRHYRHYYHWVQHKGTLSDLTQAREGMQEAIRVGTIQLLKVQGLVAIFLCLISSDLAAWLGLSTRWIPLLCIQILAGIGQFFVFIAMLLLLYIDRRRAALALVCTYLVSIVLLTFLSLSLGESFYGTGFLGASLFVAILGWFLLRGRLKRLEFLTFMQQPML